MSAKKLSKHFILRVVTPPARGTDEITNVCENSTGYS